MAHDLEALLERVTPDDVDPVDLDALHRRGVRRRWASRAAAGTAGVAAAAAIGLVGSSLGVMPAVEVDPVGPRTAAPTTTAASGGPGQIPDDPTGVAFAPSTRAIAEAAATLPGAGSGPDPDDWATLMAQEPDGQLPWLNANQVSCLYAEGDGLTADAPDGARPNRMWAETAAARNDLVAACMDSDNIRSGQFHAPGPFRLCQGTPAPAARQEMLDDPASGTAALAPDESLPPVTFPVVLTYEADCTAAGEASRLPIDVAAPDAADALVAQFNDRRRVETTIRARSVDECLSATDALALAEAVVERYGQDWRILPLFDPSGARRGPCVTLTMEPEWGTITLWPSSATEPAEVRDLASDPIRREDLADLVRDGDHGQVAEVLEVVRPRLQDDTDTAGVNWFAGNPTAQQVAELVQHSGCLGRTSAIDLAWAVHEALSQATPDLDWGIGAVEGPDATCFQVQLTADPTDPNAATEAVVDGGDETREPQPTSPAIMVQPVWTD